jgi:hypothetical protein
LEVAGWSRNGRHRNVRRAVDLDTKDLVCVMKIRAEGASNNRRVRKMLTAPGRKYLLGPLITLA